jgi:CHRD domain-containing protein
MPTKTYKLVAVALLAVTATVLTVAATSGAHKRFGHNNSLAAQLRGSQEVPGPGDPDGRGRAHIELLPGFGTVCFLLGWRNIDDPTVAHIHPGPRGVAGDPVVDLFGSKGPREKGCVDGVDPALIRQIRRHPRDFYVNVHTEQFPNGAIRGQLKRSRRHFGHR